MGRKRSSFNVPELRGRRGRLFVLKRSKSAEAEGWMSKLLPYDDESQEAGVPIKINRRPLMFVLVAGMLGFCALAYQLFSLQIVNGDRYGGLAEGNRLRRKVTYAPRGRILDRRGVVLADNQASFQLVVTPYLLSRDEPERNQMYQLIGEKLRRSFDSIKQAAEAKGLDYNQPLLVAENINYQTALLLEQKQPELTGFSLDAVPVRQYKSDAALSHLLGYVGRADEQDLSSRADLLPVDFLGKDGVESQYDQLLRGQNGVVETEVDATGRPLATLTEKTTHHGNDIQLTINYELQKVFTAAIAEQMPKAGAKRAAGVAIDPRSGEVLAMVSLPGYDNNLFTGGIDADVYGKLLSDQTEPLHNKAIGGGYPSGSIIKPMHLAGALQEKVVNENTTIVDRGKITVPSVYDPSVVYTFNGWNPSGLGPMNARRAIAMSSDIYFYTVGGGHQGFKGIGIEKLADYYRRFGLGAKTGIDLPGEAVGRVPTPDWKKQATGEDWFVGDTYNVAIGQGDILVSPLQMAVAESAIVNGGKVLQPGIFKQTVDGAQQFQTKVIRDVGVDERNLLIVKEGMRQVIGGTTPTATFASVGVPVAGKSGTAETDPEAKKKPHAWYVAFAPYDNPEIMFSVILEGGEGGSQFAAPAIAKAMSWYFGPGKSVR